MLLFLIAYFKLERINNLQLNHLIALNEIDIIKIKDCIAMKSKTSQDTIRYQNSISLIQNVTGLHRFT